MQISLFSFSPLVMQMNSVCDGTKRTFCSNEMWKMEIICGVRLIANGFHRCTDSNFSIWMPNEMHHFHCDIRTTAVPYLYLWRCNSIAFLSRCSPLLCHFLFAVSLPLLIFLFMLILISIISYYSKHMPVYRPYTPSQYDTCNLQLKLTGTVCCLFFLCIHFVNNTKVIVLNFHSN